MTRWQNTPWPAGSASNGAQNTPCPETLELLRARITGLGERIDTLVQSRQTLLEYLAATERRMAG